MAEATLIPIRWPRGFDCCRRAGLWAKGTPT